MKNAIFYSFCLIFFIFLGCSDDKVVKNQPEISTTLNSSSFSTPVIPKYNFQEVFCLVHFGNSESEILKNRNFLTKHKLSSAIDMLPPNPDWKKLDASYQKNQLPLMTEQEKNLYRQVSSIFILRNHALLAQNKEKEKIDYYTNEYISSDGNSAGLLYYCLNVLGDKVDESRKKLYIELVTKRSAETLNILEQGLKNIPIGKTQLDSSQQEKLSKIKALIESEQEYINKLNLMLSRS